MCLYREYTLVMENVHKLVTVNFSRNTKATKNVAYATAEKCKYDRIDVNNGSCSADISAGQIHVLEHDCMK